MRNIYVYEETDVLINKLGISDFGQLRELKHINQNYPFFCAEKNTFAPICIFESDVLI